MVEDHFFFHAMIFCPRKFAQRREIMRFSCFSLSDGITSLWGLIIGFEDEKDYFWDVSRGVKNTCYFLMEGLLAPNFEL